MAQALTVLHRYHAVARAMGADPFEVLATAAVRDAQNGRDFVARAAGAHARRADPHPVRRRGGGASRPRACCAASPPPTACWPISAAARWSWCAWTAASAARRRRCALGRDPAGRTIRQRSDAGARHRRGRPGGGALAGRGRRRAICIWSAAPGARWRASTWRRPAIRCRWCITTRSAARRRATWPGVIAQRRRAARWSGCRRCRAGASTICRLPPWCCAGCCG